MSPYPLESGQFVFLAATYEDGVASLHYRIDAPALQTEFVERIRFPGAGSQFPVEREQACAKALQLLHWIAGVSYYKAALPPEMNMQSGLPSAQVTALLQAIYTHGLAEFAYQNQLQIEAQFPAGGATCSTVEAVALPRRALVPIGGGKDSLVSIEAIKKAGQPACATWIGNSELIAATAKATGLPTLNIQREVAPELFALNANGALNGHVPVTAINSAVMVLAALLYGFDQIIFSNEASSNAATLHDANGEAVNHQWSKSIAFESAFSALVQSEIAPGLHYFSLLRPYRELAITSKFAKFMQYDALFSSCNRNFRILGNKPSSRWCNQCPKCHFVFLALAPFVPKPRLIHIFGLNLLDQSELAPAFDALMEWGGAHKPFECVGEAEESRAAMASLCARADWQEDALVQRFARFISPHLRPLTLASLCAPTGPLLSAPFAEDWVAQL
jgi:UDP-N-acetyl-alpha-D-muramoyl-L-alanyl-L-glutamate epimerase